MVFLFVIFMYLFLINFEYLIYLLLYVICLIFIFYKVKYFYINVYHIQLLIYQNYYLFFFEHLNLQIDLLYLLIY